MHVYGVHYVEHFSLNHISGGSSNVLPIRYVYNNNNSEVLLGAKIHRPYAPLASQEREESEN